MPTIRALSLLSGGLDSQLAVCVLKAQGIDVHGIAFESPFFGAQAARDAAAQLGIALSVVDFTKDIVEILESPKHGFGSCMNPCIDCHTRMLNRAGGMLETLGCGFLSTGEVLNERPMSQNRTSLAVVAKDSGYEDLLLRPLSATLLPETKPERLGWVDRARLLALQGRSRKPQIALAAQYGLVRYPAPAGGCLLTDPIFSRRLRDLKQHGSLTDVRALGLLKAGRHFRLGPEAKLIVGRNQTDNEIIAAAAGSRDTVLSMETIAGPVALLTGNPTPELIRVAAEICVRYSDAGAGQVARVNVVSEQGADLLSVEAAAQDRIEALRI